MSDVSPEHLMRALGGRTQRHRRPNGIAFPALDDKKTQPVNPLRIVNPVDLDLVPVPEQEWIVQDWLPVGCVTANYGDGGVGKTLLSQQLMTACATGRTWAGRAVTQCRSFGFFCEDNEDELHRRQDRICDHIGIFLRNLGDMRWISGVGSDNALVTFTADGRIQVTELFHALSDLIKAFGARLVVLDTAADLFAGNENDRHQVRQFIGILTYLAIEIGGAVLLNAHPSRAGLTSGNIDGGSTAWSNSIRSRWSLERPKTADASAEVNTAERVLTRRKANYASSGETIALRWIQGAFAPVVVGGLAFGTIRRTAIETLFLNLLDRCETQAVYLSHSSKAANFAPKMFAQRPDAEGYTAKEFTSAMVRLLAKKQIRLADYGRRGDARQRIVRDRQEQLPEVDA